MDVICEPIKKSNQPLVKKQNKVRNELPNESCSMNINAKINCTASDQNRRCCAEGLRYTPQPCNLLNESAEIEPLDCENDSFSGETEFCKKVHSFEELWVKKPSWEPCVDRVEKRPEYSEKEIRYFIEVIEQKLRDSLDRECEPLVCGLNNASCEIPEARICRGVSFGNNVQRASFTNDVSGGSLTGYSSDDRDEKSDLSKNLEQGIPMQDTCGSNEPIIFCSKKNCKEYSCVDKSEENLEPKSTMLDFKIGDIGRSEAVGKWGELNIADRLLAKYRQTNSLGRSGLNTEDLFCQPVDKFVQLDRFLCLDKKDSATICRRMFRWSNRLSKNWRSIISQPHVVIHLPSIGYPLEIRRRSLKSFDLLQNRQISRLGWLGNENAQVLYISPCNQSMEMITLFRDLVKNVRPDVAENRLWIIQPESSKIRYLNGSQALFQSTKTYQRVRMLTAGRQAFVLPGVIEEIDCLIASELRVPLMGPPLEFQNHFLNKSNVANFLQEIKVDQPPFVADVHNFPQLCEGLARLMIEFPSYVTWLIKINYGINGLQTASVSFEKSLSREIIAAAKKCPCQKCEKKLAILLMEILPGEMILNEQAYKSYTEFFCDLEKYGGLVQGFPRVDYRVLSLGVFVEHDTATPEVCASADVFHDPQDPTDDLCYGIPQATTSRLPLENLVVNVGVALRNWQYIGYFGMDVLALRDEKSIKQGSMICPIDSGRRALGLVSIYPKRSRTISEFAKGLRVLHELSLEKHNDKIKTNMLKLARALERRELEKTRKRTKYEAFR